MADNLKISTPINTNDNVGRIRHEKETNAVQIDPTRVLSKKGNDAAAEHKNLLDFMYDNRSVFQTFMERMQQTPALTASLQKLLMSVLKNPTINEESPVPLTLLKNLASQIPTNENQILENILFQQNQSTNFNGDLFKVLRELSNNSSSQQFKDYLGRFLKSYDGYTTAQSTMDGIISQLKNIVKYIPKSYSTGINEQIEGLITTPSENAIEDNLKLIKENILPLISRYISSTNDLGETRQNVTLLLQDIARLNISNKEEVVNRFKELVDYCQYSLNIPSGNLTDLKEMFAKIMMEPEHIQNKFIDSLINVLMCKSTDGLNNTSQAMLNATMRSLLLDNSVYMPFTHIFLPIQYNGTFMFSEIWVEKDDYKNSGQEKSDSGVKLYLSFDIQDLGNFQASIQLKDNGVDCKIQYPELLKDKDDMIIKDLKSIFSNNGFSISNLMSASEPFKTELEIMKKIYEGGKSIDVTV